MTSGEGSGHRKALQQLENQAQVNRVFAGQVRRV